MAERVADREAADAESLSAGCVGSSLSVGRPPAMSAGSRRRDRLLRYVYANAEAERRQAVKQAKKTPRLRPKSRTLLVVKSRSGTVSMKYRHSGGRMAH